MLIMLFSTFGLFQGILVLIILAIGIPIAAAVSAWDYIVHYHGWFGPSLSDLWRSLAG